MATFYGQVQGQAQTIASRRGSYSSHIKASVQSYDGSVITELYYGDDETLRVRVAVSDGTDFYGRRVFDGTLEELTNCLVNK